MVLKALICGGGNGAHVAAGLANSCPDVEASVITLFADEAERWTANMAQSGNFTVIDVRGGSEKKIEVKPFKVSKNPAEVMQGVQVILFVVPAFAHEQYLTELKPHVQPGTIVAGVPGQPGFPFAVRGIWGDLAKQVTIMDFVTLPWNCRIQEFGKSVQLLSIKEVLPGASQVGTPAPPSDPSSMVQQVLGPKPVLKAKGHAVGMSLSPSNAILHPTIMYGQWSNWDGNPVNEPPLFYNDLSEPTAQLLSDVSTEVVNVAKAIMQQKPQIDLSNVVHALPYYLALYGDDIEDKSSLYTVLRTCAGFKGLKHPMIEQDGKFMPNFKFRYLFEDVPFGMAVIKGIASLAGVATPKLDMVLTWAQGKMEKEYIKDGQFNGKDSTTARCPQKYGLNSLDAALGLA